MNYRDVARNTSIRNRFRCLSAIDQRKCDFLKKLSFTLLTRLHRVEDPVERECIIYKIKMLCGLSLGIRLDTYDNIPPPIRLSLLLENLTYPFCKEFLRFRKEDIHHFYVLLNFSNVCVFDNRATMSGEEIEMDCMNCVLERKRQVLRRSLAVIRVIKHGASIIL